MSIYEASEYRRRQSRPTPQENPIGKLVQDGYANWGYEYARGDWPKERIDEFYWCIKNGLTRQVNLSTTGNLYLIVCDEKKWFCTVDCSDVFSSMDF